MNRYFTGIITGLLLGPVASLSGGVSAFGAAVMMASIAGLGISAEVRAAPLAPEHEVRRLIIAAEQAIAEERWDDAAGHLGRLQNLDAAKPAEYFYFRGRVMLEASQFNEARAALEEYVARTGQEGSHYDQALQLITEVEQQRTLPTGSPNQEPVAIIQPAERIDIDALKRLYLETTAEGALAAHLNSLLSLNAWQPGPVRHNKPAETIVYQVSRGTDGSLQIRETIRTPDSGPTMRTHTVPVFGVNPAIDHACYESGRSCWLFDPRDQSRWLQLAHHPDAAAEIAQVMSEYLRELQKTD